jgi:hypothetical protein
VRGQWKHAYDGGEADQRRLCSIHVQYDLSTFVYIMAEAKSQHLESRRSDFSLEALRVVDVTVYSQIPGTDLRS